LASSSEEIDEDTQTSCMKRSISITSEISTGADSKRPRKPRRKACLTLKGSENRKKASRNSGSPETTVNRLQEQRTKKSDNRSNETPEATRKRLEDQQARTSLQRQHETAQATQNRIDENQMRTSTARSNESSIETQNRQRADQARHITSRANETETANAIRLQQQVIRSRNNRANETADERARRQLRDREYQRNRRLGRSEAAHQRELEQRRERYRESLARHRNHRTAYMCRNAPVQPVELHRLSRMNQECEHCGALYWVDEKTTRNEFKLCCGAGKIVVPPQREPLALMRQLLDPNTTSTAQVRRNKNFMANIRQYNSTLAFASIHAPGFKAPPTGQTDHRFVYRLQGAMYHKTPPVLFDRNMYEPRGGQFYIMDSDEAHRERLQIARNTHLDEAVC